ncbi:MAG: hypothetical protein WDN03_18305 [Rhizomicrobium sp.]
MLDAGRVVEAGSHAELMAQDGAYAHFAKVQGRREELVHELEREKIGAAK